ncbi:MAG: phosphatase PAP2 family protein [Clostridiales bacterium]|nr:phosphatase PAP2 family protein [Clostridiales bacterium]
MTKNLRIAFVTVAILLAVLTVCGSFFDYEIANAVYLGQSFKENPFGIIFAFIGVIPTFVGWSFLGASTWYLAKSQVKSKAKRGYLIAFATLLFLLSFFFFCNTLMMVNASAFAVHFLIAYPVGMLCIAGAGYLGYFLTKKSQNPKLLEKVLFLSLVSVVTMIVIMATKGIMDRPRFRFVKETGHTEFFKNWWQKGSALKSGFPAVSDEFSSLPSGHSAYAMFAVILFPALAEFIPQLQRRKPLLSVCGLLWWALTAFSRLTVGAHYLTDVSIAALITLGAYALVSVMTKSVLKNGRHP